MPKTNEETSTNQEEQLTSSVELPALDASSSTRKELMDKSKEALNTTSRPYGVGKPAALKLLRTNAGFR